VAFFEQTCVKLRLVNQSLQFSLGHSTPVRLFLFRVYMGRMQVERRRLMAESGVGFVGGQSSFKDSLSGVARCWCQEGHMQKLLGFTGGNCRHIVAVRLCTGQSALKKFNCCRSRGARAPVPHSWRRQWCPLCRRYGPKGLG